MIMNCNIVFPRSKTLNTFYYGVQKIDGEMGS